MLFPKLNTKIVANQAFINSMKGTMNDILCYISHEYEMISILVSTV